MAAYEVFVIGTPSCMIPVTQENGVNMGVAKLSVAIPAFLINRSKVFVCDRRFPEQKVD
jgi:hypothetical protein